MENNDKLYMPPVYRKASLKKELKEGFFGFLLIAGLGIVLGALSFIWNIFF